MRILLTSLGLIAAFAVVLTIVREPLSYEELDWLRVQQRVGEASLAEFSFAAEDRFSWSRFGERVVGIDWLGAEILALYLKSSAMSSLALSGLALSGLALSGLAFSGNSFHISLLLLAFVSFSMLLRARGRSIVGIAVGLFAYTVFYPTIGILGSHLWSYLLFPAFLGVFTQRRRLNYVWVFLISAVWINLDWGYVVGLLSSVLLLLGAFLDQIKSEQKDFFIKTLLTALAVFCSPFGLDYFDAIKEIVCGSNSLLSLYAGWVGPNFHEVPQLVVGIVLFTFLIATSRVALLWKERLLALLGLLAVLLSSVSGALFAILLGHRVARFIDEVSAGAYVESSERDRKWAAFVGPSLALLCAIALTVLASGVDAERGKRVEPLRIELENYAESLPGALRLYNDIAFGGELMSIDQLTFVDRRIELFSGLSPTTATGSVLGDYLELRYLEEAWPRVLEHWQFNAVLVYRDTALAETLLKVRNWRILALGDEHWEQALGRVNSKQVVLLVP